MSLVALATQRYPAPETNAPTPASFLSTTMTSSGAPLRLRPRTDMPAAVLRSGETFPVAIGYQTRPAAAARHKHASLPARYRSTPTPLVRLINATLGPARPPFPIADGTHANAVDAAVRVSTIGPTPPPPTSGTRGKASSPDPSLSPTSAAERGVDVCGALLGRDLSLSKRIATADTATSDAARPARSKRGGGPFGVSGGLQRSRASAASFGSSGMPTGWPSAAARAKSSRLPGTPFSSCDPRSVNSRPEPATRC